MIKLNLGCGNDFRDGDGWVNIDMNPKFRADIYHDLHKPLPFDDLSVDHVYASHVLEHCGFHVVNYCVADWVRVLKIGGTIDIITPDLRTLAEDYIKSSSFYPNFVNRVFGGGYRSVRGSVHNICVDASWLRGQLWSWGCGEIEQYQHDKWELCMRAVKAKHVSSSIPPIDLYTDEEINESQSITPVDFETKKRGRPRAKRE